MIDPESGPNSSAQHDPPATGQDSQQLPVLETNQAALQGSIVEQLEQLRQAGGPHWDPVGFRYCESLTGAAQGCGAALARRLESRASDAIGASLVAVTQRRNSAVQTLNTCLQLDPTAYEALGVLLERGDLNGLQRARQRLEAAARQRPLVELQRALRQHREPGQCAPTEELQASRFFREAASKRHTREQVRLALDSATGDAGPLNPHLLGARALSTLSQLSPAYLQHWVSYLDTVLWLEQQDLEEPPARG